MIAALPPCSWHDAIPTLLAAAGHDLDGGGVPLPMLVAFEGDEPLAVVTLRPFGPDETLQAFVEVLSLLLPLGADRLACSLPAQANLIAEGDPAQPDLPPAPWDPDLSTRLLLVITADGHAAPCDTELTLRAGEQHATGWSWSEPLAHGPAPQVALAAALRVLLDAREELVVGNSAGLRLAAQFGRVLLLGHELAVAPRLAQRLELATSM